MSEIENEEIAKLRKRLEDREWANRKIVERVRIFYKRLERRNEQLEKLNRLKSQFLAMVSHEFKNPLLIIKESLNIVLEGVVGEINSQQKEILEGGRRNIDRLIRLVTDILNISKIEAGRMEMRRERVSIVLLVNEILTDYKETLHKKQIVLEKNMPQDIGLLWADKDKLSEVIINLLNNAVNYTPEKGKVAISLEGTDREIRFEISDAGPGIPKEHFNKIFDRFERLTLEKRESTGLGLPIAKDIIRLHKGNIWVESELGKGSKFIFVLPRDLRK